MTTVVACSGCKLWILPFSYVNQIVEEKIQTRQLKKVARMKLNFRLARFDTLKSASRCLRPASAAVKKRASGTKAWTSSLETKTSSPPPSSSSTVVEFSPVDPRTEKGNEHTA